MPVERTVRRARALARRLDGYKVEVTRRLLRDGQVIPDTERTFTSDYEPLAEVWEVGPK